MNDNTTYYTNLITRYFAGETTEEELRLLSDWLKADPQNQELFNSLRKTWQLIEKQKIHDGVNTNQEWNAMQLKMEEARPGIEKKGKVLSFNESNTNSRSWLQKVWKVAASVAVLVVSSFLLYFYFSKPEIIVVTAQAATIEQVLPDGSVVSLHSGAQIKYPAKFDSKIRKVELKGEAYFEVAHDKTKPFVVASGDARVEVLGTKFNINTTKATGTMEVVLTSGKVSVFYKRSPQQNVLLLPGEKAVLLVDQKQISKSANSDPNYMAWKTRVLTFNDETLAQVVNTLQNVYQATITLKDPQLSECRVTASFSDQSLQSVLQVLKETLDLQVTGNGKRIELSGKSCR